MLFSSGNLSAELIVIVTGSDDCGFSAGYGFGPGELFVPESGVVQAAMNTVRTIRIQNPAIHTLFSRFVTCLTR
jgi:hypothetical protein